MLTTREALTTTDEKESDVQRIPFDKAKQRRDVMTEVFKANPNTTYGEIRALVKKDFSEYAVPADGMISAAKKGAGLKARFGPRPKARKLKRVPVPRAMAEERRRFLLKLFTSKPSMTNDAARAAMKEEWPKLPGASQALLAEMRAASKKARRSVPRRSVVEELKAGTVPHTMPVAVSDCLGKLKTLMKDYEIAEINLTNEGVAEAKLVETLKTNI